LEGLRVRLSQNSDGAGPASGREANKQQALRAIDRKLERLESCKADCEKREAAEEQARQAAAVLPSPQVLDKIMRYEAMLQRQLYRAMAQLERLQRMRQGESVPPPMTMEVSERV
jgi:CRISPR/Cas system-associated endonuclease Cas1